MEKSKQSWHIEYDLEEKPWNIGLIIGPSGCGKSTIAEEIFGKHIKTFEWSEDKSVVDDFPEDMSIKEITKLLSSVGFSSPPGWVKPYHVLSTGEQFRVLCARTLAENDGLSVIDEFTSVVDRDVAKIASHTVQRVVRQRKQKLIAVSCHYDILDWLQPDWILEPLNGVIQWRSVQRRPKIQIEIYRADRSIWPLFAPHHYLSTKLHRAAQCYVAVVWGRLAAFYAMIPFPHPKSPGWRGHRAVCLPDFQGVGLGRVLVDVVSAHYKTITKNVGFTTSHPAMNQSLNHDPLWRMIRKPSINAKASDVVGFKRQLRYTTSFRYVGPAEKLE